MKREMQISKKIVIMWQYIKYQLITKGLLFAIAFPLFSLLLNYLIKSTGRVNISSGDYIKFLFSFQGLGALILALIMLILLVGLDINAFIIMSALIKEGKLKLKARHMLLVGLKSMKSFLKPSGVLIMLYMAIVIPLVGIGFTISPMKGFQIPNFITSVIFSNPLYSALYFVLMLVLTIISIKYIFVFHYILLAKNNISTGLKNASKLMKNSWKRFICDFFLKILIHGLMLAGVLAVLAILLFLPAKYIARSGVELRIFNIFIMILIAEIISFVGFMIVPHLAYLLTELFYKYNALSHININVSEHLPENIITKEKGKGKAKLSTKIAISIFIAVILLINISLSVFYGINFDEIFKQDIKIEIIAHRAGGVLAAENSLAGLQAAIDEKAAWSEIDVQRTKDGQYIINHDNNFKRLAGVNKGSTDMELKEIKELKINDLFDPTRPAQKVGTLEEFLDAANGKIGLFIELKGKTADKKMVDDVVKMIKEKQMDKQTALLSLDYELIKYIEEKYPYIQSGFLYFFSIGETTQMKGDMLIMEEGAATENKVEEIKAAGKKAIVWTVNTQESIDKFLNSDVDGIITDNVKDVKESINNRKNRTDFEIIMDNFLN